MASYFLDTSALAKLHVREARTEKMLKLVARPDRPQPGHPIALASRTPRGCAAWVRSRELSEEAASVVIAALSEHLSSIYVVQHVNEAMLERAMDLSGRHELRAYDSIQLAACMTLPVKDSEGRATFTCADDRLVAAAEAEGWPVMNPAV